MMRVMGGVLVALCMLPFAAAQTRHPVPPGALAAVHEGVPALDVVEWLQRMHTAASQRAYAGTFVVWANGGGLSSARIWHVCEGGQQMERVETLSGPPRSIFRRDDSVLTFLPESRVVRSEKRETLGLFPGGPQAPDSSIAQFYGARPVGRARVAGLETNVVQLLPRDALRFGYRVWTEQHTGLLVKLQTLDGDGRVLEQSAFSELQLDAPVKARVLRQMMSSTAGYRAEKVQVESTSADAEGWMLTRPVPGFRQVSCLRRVIDPATQERAMQWVFSDGLASVSLFVQPYGTRIQPQEGLFALGATHTLTRRIVDAQGGQWWLSAMGEVPPQTLDAFAQSLARKR